tara:strand:+ start:18027 stop:19832 length:1806 start_codon:yes stop_codon:yes gene_type:complete
MKLSKLLTGAITCATLLSAQHAAIAANSAKHVTAYLLLDDKTDTIHSYLPNLVSQVNSGAIHMDELVISFINPSMNPETIAADGNDVNKLIVDAGLLPSNIGGDSGTQLKTAIDSLEKDGVDVSFAVGGWGYSCKDPSNPRGGCTANFPLTHDIVDNFSKINLKTDAINTVQTVDSTHTIANYADTWAKVVKAFDAKGLDFDYEENWFSAETTFKMPVLASPEPSWSANPNGPYSLPYSVVKYASTLKALEDASVTAGLDKPTTAAPSPAAFNVHTYDALHGNNLWCPVKDKAGNSVCGQSASHTDYSQLTVAGNLKGVMYDVAHAETLGTIGKQDNQEISYQGLSDLFSQNIIGGLSAVNIMSYDLDDGYDSAPIEAKWCMAFDGGPGKSRDPSVASLAGIDCSITSQSEALVRMFKANVMTNTADTRLGFGLEAGFPNYPINIDASLPGGGNADQTDPHYRWNDKFIMADLPLKSDMPEDAQQTIQHWLDANQTSDADSSVDKHSEALVVNQALFQRMQTAGADSLILWSLNNADYNDHLGPNSWDKQQLDANNTAAFGKAAKSYGYTTDVLNAIYNNAASPEDMLATANSFYHPTNKK